MITKALSKTIRKPCISLIRKPCQNLIRKPCQNLIRKPCQNSLRKPCSKNDDRAFVLRKPCKFLVTNRYTPSEYFDEKIPLSCYHCDHRFNGKGCWFVFLNHLIRSRRRDIVLQTPLGSSNIHVYQNFSALGNW